MSEPATEQPGTEQAGTEQAAAPARAKKVAKRPMLRRLLSSVQVLDGDRDRDGQHQDDGLEHEHR